jgi:tetratricopeptide (TPR) repeat protein
VDLCPEDGYGHVFLGAYLVQRDRYEEAAAEVGVARVLYPGSETVAQVATDVLREVKGDAAALAELDEAIRQIGEDPQLLVLRAVLLAHLDQAPEALALVIELRGQGVSDSRLQITEGIALNALGRYPEAIPILDAALQENSGSVEVRANLADALNHVGETVQAAEVLGEIDENAFDARILTIRGQIRRNLGDKGCLEDLREALERDASRSEVRIELIDTAVEFGENSLAKQYLTELLRDGRLADDPRVVRLAWLVGEQDLALQRVEGILASAEASKQSMDQAACAALVYKSAILLERGQVEPAIAAARSAVQIDDANPNARFVLSAALKAAGSLDEALAVLGSEDNPQLTPQRVQLLLDSGRREEAVRLVRRVVRAKPGDDRLTTGLLDALTAQGLLLQAARMLEPCLGAEPSAWILRSAGLLLSAMGDFQRAVGILELARRRSSQLPDVDAMLAWAYSNLTTAKPGTVVTAANRALKRQPDDLYVLRTKADALLEMNRQLHARRLYKQILTELSSRPNFLNSGSLAGWCSYRLGEYERALDNLLRAISASPVPNAADRFDLALVLFVAGRPSRAKREFAQAIEECRALPSPLQRHGILQVAMVDLDDVVALGPPGLNLTVGEQLQAMLRRQLKAAQSSFVPVRPFLDGIDGVLKPRRRRTNSNRTVTRVGA